MPELPEVETIRRSLLPRVVGARIRDVDVRERRLRRRIQGDLAARLRGRSVVRLDRRGKYLLLDLDDGQCLLIHLGMSGSLEIRADPRTVERHDHVRLLGLMRVATRPALHELERIGPDPLTDHWSVQHLGALAHNRRLPIKNLLMDQRAIGGIGNIYANEILYEAAVRPTRRAGRLRRRELEAVVEAAVRVLERAVHWGGSSISDYRDGEGRPGSFQYHFAVYDRAGEPCRRCTTPIRRLVQGGRSSFYCRRCQR
jgi:formamidopyrimidine-DNA glycosylase